MTNVSLSRPAPLRDSDRYAIALPGALVAPVSPMLFVAFNAITANQMCAARVIVPATGTLTDLSVLIGTQSGNIACAVYDTGDAVSGSRTRLYTTGSIACPAAGWNVVGDPALKVTAGQQLDLVVAADNATVTFGRINGASSAAMQLPANFWPAAGGASPKLSWQKTSSFPPPTSVTEANCTAQSIYFAVIARVTI